MRIEFQSRFIPNEVFASITSPYTVELSLPSAIRDEDVLGSPSIVNVFELK